MATQRFLRAGITRMFLVPSIASATLVPTAAEVNAGTELTAEVSTVTGFSFSNQTISTPDLKSTFESEIPGKDKADASDLEMYQRKGTDTLRAAQAKGTAGFMVILFDGTAGANPAAGDKADVFPVSIASNSKVISADNVAAMYKATYTITDKPAQDVVLT